MCLLLDEIHLKGYVLLRFCFGFLVAQEPETNEGKGVWRTFEQAYGSSASDGIQW